MAPFWKNALHWLDEGRQGVVGVKPDVPIDVLSKSGLQCEKTNFRDDLSVFVCKAYSDDLKEKIQNFVAEGGGLLVGGHAWWWAQSHPGQNEVTDFPGTSRTITHSAHPTKHLHNACSAKMTLTLIRDIPSRCLSHLQP